MLVCHFKKSLVSCSPCVYCACSWYHCTEYTDIAIFYFRVFMLPSQMIHEDGGSRSKGSPAGKTLKNISLHSSLKLTTRREKEQESDEDSRAQVQTNLNSKSLLTTALTIESRFMSFYDSTMSTFLEQRAIQRALKATSDWKVNWYSLFTCMSSSWCFISCQHMFPQL